MDNTLNNLKTIFFKRMGIEENSFNIRSYLLPEKQYLIAIGKEDIAEMNSDDIDDDYYGITIYGDTKADIYINASKSMEEIEATYIHELTHAVWHDKRLALLNEYEEGDINKKWLPFIKMVLEYIDELNAEYTASIFIKNKSNLNKILNVIATSLDALKEEPFSAYLVYPIIASWIAYFPNESSEYIFKYNNNDEELIGVLSELKAVSQAFLEKYHPLNIWDADDEDIFKVMDAYISVFGAVQPDNV